MSTPAENRITELVSEVQKIVLEEAGLALTADEILQVHMLSMEPKILARSIVFSVTGKAIADPDDDDLPGGGDTPAGG